MKHQKGKDSPADEAPAPQATGKTADQPQESEISELRRTVQEYKDRNLRLYAEFENARKRFDREKRELIKYGNEELIREFLTILDDLERSVNAAGAKHQDYASFLKGVEMIMAHIYEMLKRNDLRPIEAVGKKFDPHCHEVLMQVESDDQEEETVVEEFQKGYYLGDRVIRTAKVKVAVSPRSKQQASPAETDSAGENDNKEQNT